MDNIQNMQKLMGDNPMIKSVLSNPEHMATAQKMLKNPETQKQIGGIIANPEIMQKAATMLDGLHKMNMNGGGRKARRKKKGLMCPKNCCGLPVTKCGCPKSCGHCNCKEIQRLRKLLRKKSTRKKKSKRGRTKKKRRRKRTKKKRKRRRRGGTGQVKMPGPGDTGPHICSEGYWEPGLQQCMPYGDSK